MAQAKRDTVILPVRLPRETYEALQRHATPCEAGVENTGVSALLRTLAQQYVTRRAHKTPQKAS